MNKLLLLCAYAFYAQYLLKPQFRKRLFFGLVLLVTGFAMCMAAEKAPMANFLIALFMVYVFAKRKGVVSIKMALCFGVPLLAVLGLLYMKFTGTEDPVQAILGLFSRVFTGQIQPAYRYLEFFPNNHDFLLGRSFPNPGGIFAFEQFHLTRELMDWYYPGISEIGILGSMPTVYWGEMYVNFGFFGVLAPPFFVGLVLYWLNHLILRFHPDPLVIAIFVWLLMHMMNLSTTSLSSYIIDIYLWITILLFLVIAFVSGKGVVKVRRRPSAKQEHFNSPEVLCFNKKRFGQ